MPLVLQKKRMQTTAKVDNANTVHSENSWTTEEERAEYSASKLAD